MYLYVNRGFYEIFVSHSQSAMDQREKLKIASKSVVLADGQTSGRGAKAVSQLVVRKVIGLLAEGVRDGAAARAASDALYTEKQGKVICTLNIASVDLHSGTIVLARNMSPCAPARSK